jgi:hypothetical protein
VLQVKQIKEPSRLEKQKHDTSKRGKVGHFSRKSRRNLLNRILQLEHRTGYYFVTLTYQEYKEEFTTWKNDLRALYSSLHYHYPKMGFLWKLEYQKRGAPHFHLLLFDPSTPPLKELSSLVKKHWYKIVGQKSKEFRHHGVKVEVITNIKKSGFYLAMYQAKDLNERLDIPSGRSWGIKGKDNMPFSELGSLELDDQTYIIFKRTVRKWMSKQHHTHHYITYLKNRFGSFNIFMPVGEQIRLVRYITASSA